MIAFPLLLAAQAAFASYGPSSDPAALEPKIDKSILSDFRPATDLGETGNLLVAKRFAAYRTAHPGGLCRAQGGGRRAIVTGFGLFSGVRYNISGAIVRSMAEPAFWPASVRLDEARPQSAPPLAAPQGNAGFNRTLEIDGERFDVCFLTLDVIWDLAGAIVIDEASQFKPEAVIMTGRGGWEASFEAGSLNSAARLSGFDSDGRSMDDNRPRSSWVLEDYPSDHALPMTWDPSKLAGASRADIQTLGYSAVGQLTARRDNDYLCNNIAFVVAHAMRNKTTRLAGGKIDLPSPELETSPVVGFLHLPAVDGSHSDLRAYGDGIFGWAKVLARTLKLSLSR